MLLRRFDVSVLMRREATTQIIGRTDVDVAVAQFEEINVPHGYSLPTLLRSFGRHPTPPSTKVACHRSPSDKTDVDGSAAQLVQDGEDGSSLPTLLRSFGRHPTPPLPGWPATRSPS